MMCAASQRPAACPSWPAVRYTCVRHVLEDSGSVDWDDKRDIYRAAATVTELRPAVFHALLGSYHAVSGSLDPAEALILLDRLHLPADTKHLPRLRAVLYRGHHHAALVDQRHIGMILRPVNPTPPPPPWLLSVSTTVRRDALMDNGCRTPSHEPFTSPPAAPALA